MKPSERLKILQTLAAIQYRRDAARLADLRAQEVTHREAAAHWSRQSAYAPEPDEPTPMTAVAAWQAQAARLKVKAEGAAEALTPDLEAARADLGRSFGRRQAVTRVLERAERREAPSRYRS